MARLSLHFCRLAITLDGLHCVSGWTRVGVWGAKATAAALRLMP